MTTVSIFAVKLGRMVLVCERTSVNEYVLVVQGSRHSMPFDSASALGGAVDRIKWRAKKAVDGKMKPGPIFGIQLPDTKIMIGVTDDGCNLYAEVGGEYARLDEQESEALMVALGRLRRDVNDVDQASNPRPTQLSVGESMRDPELALPAWADDTLWDAHGRRR
jgi:hypothetical protein